jgi:tight adherence protein C
LVVLAWTAFLVRRRWRRDGDHPWEADKLGQVLYIALSAGLPVAAALEFAAGEVEPSIAAEVRAVLREARSRGLAAALSEADGSTRRLLAVLARAQVTGSSAMNAVAAHIEEDRKRRRAAAREAAQRLPVRLTVPLALLILPGFVLLTIGPTVIATVERLLGPLLP